MVHKSYKKNFGGSGEGHVTLKEATKPKKISKPKTVKTKIPKVTPPPPVPLQFSVVADDNLPKSHKKLNMTPESQLSEWNRLIKERDSPAPFWPAETIIKPTDKVAMLSHSEKTNQTVDVLNRYGTYAKYDLRFLVVNLDYKTGTVLDIWNTYQQALKIPIPKSSPDVKDFVDKWVQYPLWKSQPWKQQYEDGVLTLAPIRKSDATIGLYGSLKKYGDVWFFFNRFSFK